jgi:hypothetical protein
MVMRVDEGRGDGAIGRVDQCGVWETSTQIGVSSVGADATVFNRDTPPEFGELRRVRPKGVTENYECGHITSGEIGPCSGD